MSGYQEGSVGPIITRSRSFMRYRSPSCSGLLEMNLSSAEVEAWDDVGGYLASAPAEAHMFVGAWFPRLARPRNMNVRFLQYLLWQVIPR